MHILLTLQNSVISQRTDALTYEDVVARLGKLGELHQKGLLLGGVFEKKSAALNRQLAELI